MHLTSTLRRLLSAGLFAAAIAAAATASAQPAGFGPLDTVLTSGPDGAWTRTRSGGSFELLNTAAPNALKYFFVATGEEGRRRVGVDVRIEDGGQLSHAGLLYGYVREPLSYYIFTLEAENTVALRRFEGGAMNAMFTTSGGTVRAGINRLEIAERGTEIDLFVNGSRIGSIGNEGIGSGAIGIAAWGTGRFIFSGFAVENEGAALPPRAELSPAVLPPAVLPPAGVLPPRRQPAGVAIAAAPPPASAPRGAGDAADPGFVRLTRFDVMDHQGWGQPVIAYSFLVPADWRVEGEVVWNPRWRCLNEIATARVNAASPDGRLRFEVFPVAYWDWVEDLLFVPLRQQEIATTGKGCFAHPPTDAAGFLSDMLAANLRPNARVVDVEAMPAVAQAAANRLRASGGMGPDTTVDAARITIADREREEWLMATSYVIANQTLSPSAAANGGLQYVNAYQSGAESIFAFSAPAGELAANDALFAAIVGSVRVNPVWQAALVGFFAAMQRETEIEGSKRAQIWQEAQAGISAVIVDGWRERQGSLDRVAAGWSQAAVRETATYVAPTGDFAFELPDGYAGAWSNAGGDVLLATRPGLDPNTELNAGNWTELQRRN